MCVCVYVCECMVLFMGVLYSVPVVCVFECETKYERNNSIKDGVLLSFLIIQLKHCVCVCVFVCLQTRESRPQVY